MRGLKPALSKPWAVALGCRQADPDKRSKIANHDWRYNSQDGVKPNLPPPTEQAQKPPRCQEKRLKHEPMLNNLSADKESGRHVCRIFIEGRVVGLGPHSMPRGSRYARGPSGKTLGGL